MKCARWAGLAGVQRGTANRWLPAGLLPVPARQRATGTVLVDPPAPDGVAGDARASSADQRGDLGGGLDGQVTCPALDGAARGLAPLRVESAVGSALDGNRSTVRRLFADPGVGTVVAEHRDPARGACVDAALAARVCRIVVLDAEEVADDLVGDMVEVRTAMCARLYGRESARRRAQRAVEAAGEAST